MITPEKRDVSSAELNTPNKARIDALKKKINNEEYLFEAIHRIAFVLSNEISGVSGGGTVERKG